MYILYLIILIWIFHFHFNLKKVQFHIDIKIHIRFNIHLINKRFILFPALPYTHSTFCTYNQKTTFSSYTIRWIILKENTHLSGVCLSGRGGLRKPLCDVLQWFFWYLLMNMYSKPWVSTMRQINGMWDGPTHGNLLMNMGNITIFF